MTIAITGASGQLGRIVLDKLGAKLPASEFIALARSREKLADSPVAVREADYTRPETLGPALEGVDTLLLISSSEVGQRAAQHRNVIAAAKAAGVGHIVYTSLLHADRSPISLAEEHRQTEAELAASGIPHTILRNGWYTENYTGTLGGTLAAGAVIGSAGNGRISAATREDYAEAAVAVLVGTGHQGRIYELAGDEAFTLADLAAEISRQTGRDIPYRNMAEADYAKALAGFGLPAPVAAAIATWDTAAAGDALFDDGHALSDLIGRPTTPLAQAISRALP
ncbi:SDR family oxidoreductase [Arsenicitalea aurantiaca]|uniref:SDR family oxidoreductase n=1 Tax=Arsenicitalea aurantiaca TaxID=1783274 RepID=A0A433XAL1_9HYPH|nr:SDR family oxidoreductase [Arsenicitalea aurantiaca]RUT31103.1 SDR family oxidoreductase [Arsenicitalea aurantiaca]